MSETGKGKVKKEALLTDSDNLWAEFRHDHIGKVLTDLGTVGLGLGFEVGLRFEFEFELSLGLRLRVTDDMDHRCLPN